MQSVSVPGSVVESLVDNGWCQQQLACPCAAEHVCETLTLTMAAEDYPLKDILRLNRILGERLAEALRHRSSARDLSVTAGSNRLAQVADAPGWDGPPPVVLRYRVSESDVRIEIVTTTLERVFLLRKSHLGWIRYRREGEQLVVESSRLVH